MSIGKNHIDIPNVSFAVNGKNENDLSKMNTTNWTTKSSIAVDGSGTPFVTGDGKMIAFGTFARTFGTGTQNTDEKDDNYGKWTITDKSNIIAGRSDLKGCYFFSNGKMYSSATRARGLRGFSVWFAPTLLPAALPNLPTFSLMVYPWTRPLVSARSSMAKKKAELTDSPMASIA